MAIKFACDACGRRFSARADQAGKRSKCPICGTEIRVPLAEESAHNGAAAAAPAYAVQIDEELVEKVTPRAAVEIPGLRASPDDEYNDVPGVSGYSRFPSGQGPLSPAGPATEGASRPFSWDPWYYFVLRIMSYLALVFAGVLILFGIWIALNGAAGVFFGLLTWCYALGIVAGVAVVLLLVDLACNVRRLRLHADRNAGIV